MSPLVQKLAAVVLPVDIQQKRPQLAKLRGRNRHTVNASGRLSLRSYPALQNDLAVIHVDLVIRTPALRGR